MPTTTNSPGYTRATVPEVERCRFTSAHGRRCANPHHGADNKFCPTHARHMEKLEDAKAREVSEQLLSGGPDLLDRQEVGRAVANLFVLISQKRISRLDGVLLAYVASLLLQTMVPLSDKPDQVRILLEGLPRPQRNLNRDDESSNA